MPGAGRPPGSKNKATLEREAAILEATGKRPAGRKLGKDILSEAANYFFGMAARYQPTGDTPNESKFQEYLKTAADIAAKVAPYESSRLASVQISDRRMDLSRLTDEQLDVFEQLVAAATDAGGIPGGADAAIN